MNHYKCIHATPRCIAFYSVYCKFTRSIDVYLADRVAVYNYLIGTITSVILAKSLAEKSGKFVVFGERFPTSGKVVYRVLPLLVAKLTETR